MSKQIPYTQTEQPIIQSKILSKNDKWVYIVIKSFRNRKSKLCFPSIRKIIDRSELSKKTVLKGMSKLKTVGVMTWEAQKGFKKNNRYRFPLEDGTEQEISRVLDNLQMGEKGTIVDGLKENQLFAQKRTNYGLGNKEGPKAMIASDLANSQKVQKRTSNYLLPDKINQQKGTDDRPAPQKAGGLSVLTKTNNEAMTEFVRVHLKLKEIPEAKIVNEAESLAKLKKQAEQLRKLGHNLGTQE